MYVNTVGVIADFRVW